MNYRQILATLLLLLMANAPTAQAQITKEFVFAVDLSMSETERSTARELIYGFGVNAKNQYKIGLTLFDDTVRRHLDPAWAESEHLTEIDNALSRPMTKYLSTSNLAIGIERALDSFDNTSFGQLVIFSRGNIDTPTQDPRARFSEWLELILLPQAFEQNVSITLAIPQSRQADPVVEQAFLESQIHQIIKFHPGDLPPAELAALLNVEVKPYGQLSSISNTPTEIQPVVDKPADSGMAQELENNRSNRTVKLVISLFLILLSVVILSQIAYRKFRKDRQHSTSSNSDTTVKSGTYLPLKEPPSKSMSDWIIDREDSNEANNNAQQGSSDVRTKIKRRKIATPTDVASDEQDPL